MKKIKLKDDHPHDAIKNAHIDIKKGEVVTVFNNFDLGDSFELVEENVPHADELKEVKEPLEEEKEEKQEEEQKEEESEDEKEEEVSEEIDNDSIEEDEKEEENEKEEEDEKEEEIVLEEINEEDEKEYKKELQDIKGIGKKTADKIVLEFGVGWDNLANASEQELYDKLDDDVAEKLIEHLNE